MARNFDPSDTNDLQRRAAAGPWWIFQCRPRSPRASLFSPATRFRSAGTSASLVFLLACSARATASESFTSVGWLALIANSSHIIKLRCQSRVSMRFSNSNGPPVIDLENGHADTKPIDRTNTFRRRPSPDAANIPERANAARVMVPVSLKSAATVPVSGAATFSPRLRHSCVCALRDV